jgi:hypothetical protein
MSPELVNALQERWQEVETIHAKLEGSGLPADLFQWYACETTRIARKLAKAGWVSTGYDNPAAPNVMQWRYDPVKAEYLLALADAVSA